MTESRGIYARRGLALAFLRASISSDEEGCILWPFTTTDGYGQVKYKGRRWRAHMLALVLSGQPRPEGYEAVHDCDQPACINTKPGHLHWDTHQANITAALDRGRLRRDNGRFTTSKEVS